MHQGKLVEPVFAIVTALMTPNFEKHVKSLGIDLCFEKPMSVRAIKKLLDTAQSNATKVPLIS